MTACGRSLEAAIPQSFGMSGGNRCHKRQRLQQSEYNSGWLAVHLGIWIGESWDGIATNASLVWFPRAVPGNMFSAFPDFIRSGICRPGFIAIRVSGVPTRKGLAMGTPFR